MSARAPIIMITLTLTHSTHYEPARAHSFFLNSTHVCTVCACVCACGLLLRRALRALGAGLGAAHTQIMDRGEKRHVDKGAAHAHQHAYTLGIHVVNANYYNSTTTTHYYCNCYSRELLIVLLHAREILARLQELALLHALANVPVDERLRGR